MQQIKNIVKTESKEFAKHNPKNTHSAHLSGGGGQPVYSENGLPRAPAGAFLLEDSERAYQNKMAAPDF